MSAPMSKLATIGSILEHLTLWGMLVMLWAILASLPVVATVVVATGLMARNVPCGLSLAFGALAWALTGIPAYWVLIEWWQADD